MKKIKTMLLLCVIALTTKAQTYGETTYPHTGGTRASCGIRVALDPTTEGILVAGYQNPSTNFNFCIDRPWIGGIYYGSPGEFALKYSISADISGSCVAGLTSIGSCTGVSVIEGTTTIASVLTTTYAVAGAFDEGVFFTILDGVSPSYGVPMASATYEFLFPYTPAKYTKPLIYQQNISAGGNFFIVGSYDQTMYAMSLNAAGTVAWSYTYAIQGEPRAIIESPYSNNPVTIVGFTGISGIDDDGFIMQLNAGNGSVINFYRYDNGGTEAFSSVDIAQATTGGGNGFIVGGFSATGSEHAWFVKLNQTGSTILLNNTIQPSSDSNAGDVVAVIERYSVGVPLYQYYGTMTSSLGIIVVKLDDNLVNWNIGYSPAKDEFVYNAVGLAPYPVGITCINNISSTPFNTGLLIFGGDDVTTPASHYYVQSYFSGEAGCNTPIIVAATSLPGTANANPTISKSTGLSICNNIVISSSANGSTATACGPYTSLGGASNTKSSAMGLNDEAITNQIQVYPNPITDKAKIKIANSDNKLVAIRLLNGLGQIIKTIYNEEQIIEVNQQVELDFKKLNLEYGLYFLEIESNGLRTKQKIIYTK